jgi:hypothetical protein
VALVRNNVSEELISSIISVTRIGELGITLQEPHGVTFQETAFSILKLCSSLNIRDKVSQP